MPQYTVTDPNSGRTISLTGDTPPSEQDIQQAFAAVPQQAQGGQNIGGQALNFLFPQVTKAITQGPQQIAQDAAQQPNAQGNLGQSLMNAAGSTGQLAKVGASAIPELASWMIPFGKGANIATKALLPGAASGGLTAAGQPGANPATVGEGAAAGALTAGPLHVLGSLVGSASKGVGDGLNSLGNAFSLSQYKVPATESMKLGLGQAVQKLQQYGLNDLNAIKDVIPQVTGNDGLITQMTHAAVKQAAPADMGGFMDFMKRSVFPSEAILTEPIKQNILNNVKNVISGAANGKTLEGGDPETIFKAIQTFQGLAKENMNKNGELSQAVGSTYNKIVNELEDRLFMGGVDGGGNLLNNGADNVLLNSVKTPEMLAKLEAVNPKLAQAVEQVQNVRQLRSVAAPFVVASKAIDRTQSATNNSPIKTSDYWLGASSLFNPHILGILAAKKLMDSNAGKTMAADVLHGAGGVVQKNNQNMAKLAPILQQLLQVSATKGAGATPSLLNQPN